MHYNFGLAEAERVQSKRSSKDTQAHIQACVYMISNHCQGTGRRCSRAKGGTHTHTVCGGGICKATARYPRELCRAILYGFSAQLKVDGRLLDGCYGVQVADGEEELRKSIYGPEQAGLLRPLAR